ncbi:MAG: NAD(P)-dependent oxidoreductase [Alphaproteobacteria bacterium]|nr:NAD(P)-dependent oxidoreductase [Alphaproteobacteria bacterium]
MELGYVGLGNMGGALARRLLLQRKLRVYDLRPETMDRLAERGATPTQSPRALAEQCDLVMTCLPTSDHVRAAIFGADGLAAGLKPGSLIADMTTGDPNATRAMAAEAADRGITLFDAPVSGGPHGADAGTIAIMVGAPDELYARVKPVFETISPNVFHCGDVGSGHVMKLVNNIIAAGVRTLTFEAVAMGVKNGLSLEKCAEVLHKGSARSYSTEITLPRLASGDLLANFTLGLMHKDVRLACQLGIDSGAPMPVANLVRELFQMAINDHGSHEDVNMLIRLIERNAAVRVVGG